MHFLFNIKGLISKVILMLFCLSTMAAHAQAPGEIAQDEPDRKIKGRKAWFLCTSIPESVKNPVLVMTGGKIHEITLSIRNMSDPFPVSGDGVVQIVKEVDNPQKPGAVIYDALSESKIPDHIQQALIILVPSSQKEGFKPIFNSKVLDLNGFNGGDYLYLNLTPRMVGIVLGDSRSVLKPWDLMVQTNREIKSATNKVLSLHYQSPDDGKWKLIVATTVVVQPTRREICVFHWDEKTERIDYRGATFPLEVE